LVAALASWLDARAHGGTWLVRIEDVDTPRCLPGVDALILHQLAACGLVPDAPPAYQSQRSPLYQQALDQLVANGRAYPCACSRKEIEIACTAIGQQRSRNAELVYPGTCRTGLHGRPARAWRLHTEKFKENRPLAHDLPAPVATKYIANEMLAWSDRLLGPQQQDLAAEVGDFVLRRADGLWAYQLAVVVDDAAQAVTHVVRGQDLADNTPRQIWLQQALGLPTPQYLHTPLVRGANGEKLSKQNGAQALDLGSPLAALHAAAQVLGLAARHGNCGDALAAWIVEWQSLHNG
jgi:glutamyl-Q tRNA(Asp) synthetase